jgi:hypothetical protein
MNRILSGLILFNLLYACSGSGTGKREEHGSESKSKYDFVIDNSCSFNRRLINQKVYSFESDIEAESALKKILKLTGLPANFKLRSASVDNACAVIKCDDQGNCDRYILYNQEFMEMIKDETSTHYSELAILAHEIAHHLSGHTLSSKGSNYDSELEADQFAGFILYKLGATVEQAKVAFKLLPKNGSASHPPRSARLAAVTNGWYDAKRNGEESDATDKTVVDNNVEAKKKQIKKSDIFNLSNGDKLRLAELKRYAMYFEDSNHDYECVIENKGPLIYLDDFNYLSVEHWPITNNLSQKGNVMWNISDVSYALKVGGSFWTFNSSNKIIGCYGGRIGPGYIRIEQGFYY